MRFRASGTYDFYPDALSVVLPRLNTPIPLESKLSRDHTSFPFRTNRRFQYVLLYFEGHADESHSGIHNSHLAHKPQAEMDVIPRRAPASNPLDHNLFSKRIGTDEATAAKLIDLDRVT